MMTLFDTKADANGKALELLRKVVKRGLCPEAASLLKELEEKLAVGNCGGGGHGDAPLP